MRATIERSAFLKALNHVQSVVERRNTIPILSNVLIEAGGGAIRLTATNLDIEIVESVAAEVAENGASTVPAHMLYDIARKLPDGAQLDLDQSGDAGQMLILAGKSRFALQALPPENFPDLAAGDFANVFALAARDLKGLIDKTRFAISTDETRYYLNGIYLHEVAQGPFLRAVATDGHRLAQAQIALPAAAKGMPGVIVPRKTMLTIAKLIDIKGDDVTIYMSPSNIRFAAGALVLTSKLVDGTFPNYERVIPRHNDKVLTVDAALFTEAIAHISKSGKTGSHLKFRIASKHLSIFVADNDSDDSTSNPVTFTGTPIQIPATFTGKPIDIGFNSRYLLDMTAQVKSGEIVFNLADAGSPTIIRDPGDDQTLYVLMPMRV